MTKFSLGDILAALACVLLMLSPVIKFSLRLGNIVDGIFLSILLIPLLLNGTRRKFTKYEYHIILTTLYLCTVAIISSLVVQTDSSFTKMSMIFVACIILWVVFFVSTSSIDPKTFAALTVVVSLIFTWISFQRSAQEIFENRLIFSFSCGYSLFCLYYLFRQSTLILRILFIILFFQFLYWATLTGNRSVIIISFIAIVFHFIINSRQKIAATMFATPFFLAAGTLYLQAFSESTMVARLYNTIDGGLGREDIWLESISGIGDTFPLGGGLGNSPLFLTDVYWPHNIILELILELGVFSLPIVITIIFFLLFAFSLKDSRVNFYAWIFVICFLNFSKSFSLNDLRLFLIPLGILIISFRFSDQRGK